MSKTTVFIRNLLLTVLVFLNVLCACSVIHASLIESLKTPIEQTTTYTVIFIEKEEGENPKEIANTEYLGEFKLTGYCNCEQCCGQWSGGPTASGVMPTSNHTIAVDTSIIPMGSKVLINGVEYTAEDTGSAIKGNKIDIYVDSHEETYEPWCNCFADVYLVKEK